MALEVSVLYVLPNPFCSAICLTVIPTVCFIYCFCFACLVPYFFLLSIFFEQVTPWVLSIYLSILQHPLARIMCRVDCDLKSDARTEKEKVKCDSVKRTSAEFKKNRLKTALLLYYGRRRSRDRTATLNWSSVGSMTTSVGRLFQ